MTQDSAHLDLRSPVERLADEHLAAMATLDPCAAARSSIAGSEDDLTDYSPVGVAARADRLRATQTALGALPPTAADRLTADLLAERLQAQLAQYDAGDLVGVLGPTNGPAAAMLRAARVVIDIGLHLGFPRPDGTAWTAENAVDMLVERAGMTRAFAVSEVDRYLGWPAQAICYKLGEREWLAARADAQQRWGAGFDLKQWHTAALDLGSLGLAQLRAQLASSASPPDTLRGS